MASDASLILSQTQISILTHKTDKTQTTPLAVQNTWYIVFHDYNVRIYGTNISVDTAGETLQMRIDIDGVSLLSNLPAANVGDVYQCSLDNSTAAANQLLLTTGALIQRAYLIEGKDVATFVRKTTANGAGTLYSKVIYGRMV